MCVFIVAHDAAARARGADIAETGGGKSKGRQRARGAGRGAGGGCQSRALKVAAHGVRITTIHTNASVFASQISCRSAHRARPNTRARLSRNRLRRFDTEVVVAASPTDHAARTHSHHAPLQKKHALADADRHHHTHNPSSSSSSSSGSSHTPPALAHHRCRPDDSSNSRRPVFSMRSNARTHARSSSRAVGYPVEWHRGRGHQGT
jgi:hypothetical protein